MAASITGDDLAQKNELEFTKGFGIAFLIDTGVLGIFHAIAIISTQ